MVLAVRQICCWNFSTALVKERSSPGENQSSSRLLWVVAIAPLEHLPCLLCTGDPQHKGSLPTPSSYVSFLLPSPSTALASLLYAWIIYTFIKKVNIQVPSTDLGWVYCCYLWSKDGVGVLFALLSWPYHEMLLYCMCHLPNWLFPEAFSSFLASGTSKEAMILCRVHVSSLMQ